MKKQLKIVSYVYSVRIYTALISIFLIPYIIKIVGYDSYGLVGFYAILMACLNILDAGIGGVLARQAIVSRESRQSFIEFTAVFNKVIKIFIFIGVSVSIIGAIFAHQYSKTWLNTSLSDEEVQFCTLLMFCIFAVRYIQGPYRSILLSNESQVAISTINFVYITLSQPVTLMFLLYFRQDIKFYFIVQFMAAAINTLLTVVYGEYIKKKIALSLVDNNKLESKISIKVIFLFALQLSTLSILWIIVNQSDKLALTKFMQLSEYAKYSVAVSVSAIIFVISDPLNQILLPRLTRSYTERNYETYTKYFTYAYYFVCLCLVPLAIFLFFFSQSLLLAWSGDYELAASASRYLPWIFLGGVFGVFSNFCFLLRYSSGDLRNHTLVYLLFSVFVVPANIYIANKYHGVGTSIFFCISSATLFFSWSVYNFNKYFVSGLDFIVKLLIPVSLICCGYFSFINSLKIEPSDRLISFIVLFGIGFSGSVIVAFYIFLIRKKINIKLRLKNA
ncbi:lipopolysaccharide biosynthesis protein [Erwinia sp. SLM-02]|uniref:lipopolysaccharide biosynthesis protein n=1 Tax=Erwinia sp. SLM-02 TaxID=3020057 RepID=UPI003080EE19